MTRYPSVITFITMCFIWAIIGSVTIPNANKWLKGTGPTLHEDVVVFNSSKLPEVNNAISIDYGKKVNIENAVSIKNTPIVPEKGLKGILYDFGEACGNTTQKLIPKTTFLMANQNMSKIALIKQSEKCFLVNMIINAELDGATAVVIYQANRSSSGSYHLQVMPKTVKIPAYFLKFAAGQGLLTDLDYFYKKHGNVIPGHTELMVRVSLMPPVEPIFEPWEFVLTVVSVLFIVAFIGCGIWQILSKKKVSPEPEDPERSARIVNLAAAEMRYLVTDEDFWREMRNESAAGNQGTRKPTLEQAVVELLPTRVFELKPPSAQGQQGEAANNTQDVAAAASPITATHYDQVNCVICIEDFEDGDVLRRLPCGHDFHRECIDVWLTKRSAACPLCMACVELLEAPQEAHVRNI